MRDKDKYGRFIQCDHSGKTQHGITGWRIDGLPAKSGYGNGTAIQHVLHRLSLLEDAVKRMGGAQCHRCGYWVTSKPEYFWVHGKKTCLECLDFMVIDEPDGVRVGFMGKWIAECPSVMSQRDRVEHWAEYLEDFDDPATQLIPHIEVAMRRAGAVEFSWNPDETP